MKNFNWQGFIDGDFAVHCDTKNKAENFLKECIKRGLTEINIIDVNSWDNYYTETCYKNYYRLGISYATVKSYKTDGVRIVEWNIDNANSISTDVKEGKLPLVKFIDAIKAYQYGSTIYCKCYGTITKYTPKNFAQFCSIVEDNGRSICAKEILEGEWYIE